MGHQQFEISAHLCWWWVGESSSFVKLVRWLLMAGCMATSTWSSADDGVLVRLVLGDARLFIWGFPCTLKWPSAALKGNKERKWASYTSEEPEAKSTREQCIRVAAIISMISLGVQHNCDAVRSEKQGASPHRESQNLRYVTDLIFRTQSSSIVGYHI